MCPGRPRMSSRIFLVSVATTSGVASASKAGDEIALQRDVFAE